MIEDLIYYGGCTWPEQIFLSSLSEWSRVRQDFSGIGGGVTYCEGCSWPQIFWLSSPSERSRVFSVGFVGVPSAIESHVYC